MYGFHSPTLMTIDLKIQSIQGGTKCYVNFSTFRVHHLHHPVFVIIVVVYNKKPFTVGFELKLRSSYSFDKN